jgi:hypothetical protein
MHVAEETIMAAIIITDVATIIITAITEMAAMLPVEIQISRKDSNLS